MRRKIRGVLSYADAGLRLRARARRKSVNEAAVDALKEGAGMASTPRKRRDLADIAGSWKTDKAIESALAEMDAALDVGDNGSPVASAGTHSGLLPRD